MHNEILESLETQSHCILQKQHTSFSITETLEYLYIMIRFSSFGKLSWNAGKVFLGFIVGSMLLILLMCFSFLIISVLIAYGILKCTNHINKKKLKNTHFVKSGKRGMLG